MGESLTEKFEKFKPLIVEFVGLPGAGKTTISQQVELKLKERDLQIVSRDKILKQWEQENLWQKVVQLLPDNLHDWHILINSLIFALQVRPINRQSFSKAAKIFANFKRNNAVALAKDCDIILLDQGLLQETWSVSITGSPPPGKYLKREIIPLFDRSTTIIIYCQIDIDTALKRIQNRTTSNSRFDQMDAKKAQELLEKYFFYLQEIINCARTSNTIILELDSSQEIKEQSKKAVNLITRHCNQLVS
ncbi:MAG: NB-ARC domain-containing protein [Pleurocapsa sp.]